MSIHEFDRIGVPVNRRLGFDDTSRTVHPLFRDDDLGVTHMTFMPDLAHTGLGGCGAFACGVTFEELACDAPAIGGDIPGPNIAARTREIFRLLNRAYDDMNVPHGERLEHMDREIWKQRDKYPELSTKFAKIKALLGPPGKCDPFAYAFPFVILCIP